MRELGNLSSTHEATEITISFIGAPPRGCPLFVAGCIHSIPLFSVDIYLFIRPFSLACYFVSSDLN